MIGTNRIIINTIAQYTRTIINMVLAFVATRVILKSLGVEDYGIYNVVAGAVSLLSFLTNSLVITTQRYLSVEQGKNDEVQSRIVFNNSFLLHILIALTVFLLLEILSYFFFNGLLNIPTNRVYQSEVLYQFVTLVLCLTFITSPYRAVLVSHENIVYISIVEVFDSIFKLLIAYALFFVDENKLILYGALLAAIQLFNLIALGYYAVKNYVEARSFCFHDISWQHLKNMFSFAGWTMYNLICNVGRVQGIAICLNRISGPIINASYGIAFQISGALSNVSASLLNAINPQLMKSEGSGNREKMLKFSEIESKFSFFLMATISIPTLFEMDRLLQLWLGEVPPNATLFSRMVIIAALCDLITVGLGSANQAIGKIKNYTITICTIKLLTLPIVMLLLMFHLPLYYCAYSYILLELLSSLIRIPFLHITAGLSYNSFMSNVIIKELIPLLINIITCWIIVRSIHNTNRFMITFLISLIVFLCSIYIFGLNKEEKIFIKTLLRKF